LRAYTVAAAAVGLGISPKVLDNILTRYDIEGVSRARQGVTRRLTANALMTLYVALRFARAASLPLGPALTLAATVIKQSRSILELEKGITIEFDLALIRKDLDARLAEAVEVAPAPRRGRPPRR
jgi:hypothetical protein